MTEQESAKIFVCAYLPNQNPIERKITIHNIKALQSNGAVIVNREVINARADSVADKIALQRQRIRLYNEAKSGYGDLTFNNPDTLEQLCAIQNYFGKPIGITHRVGINPALPLLLRRHTIYQWEHPKDFSENARQFILDAKTMTAWKDPDEHEALNILIQAQLEQGLIRTGNLTVDIKKRRALFRDMHAADVPPKYVSVVEVLGRQMNQFLDDDEFLKIYKDLKLTPKIPPNDIDQVLAKVAYEINKCDRGQRKYVELYDRKRMLTYYDYSGVPLPRTVQTGQLEVDLTNFISWISNRRIPLRPQGNAVLQFLGENIGEAISDDDAILRVWGKEGTSPTNFSHTIAVLRKWLGDANKDTEGLLVRDSRNRTTMLVDKREKH